MPPTPSQTGSGRWSGRGKLWPGECRVLVRPRTCVSRMFKQIELRRRENQSSAPGRRAEMLMKELPPGDLRPSVQQIKRHEPLNTRRDRQRSTQDGAVWMRRVRTAAAAGQSVRVRNHAVVFPDVYHQRPTSSASVTALSNSLRCFAGSTVSVATRSNAAATNHLRQFASVTLLKSRGCSAICTMSASMLRPHSLQRAACDDLVEQFIDDHMLEAG